MYPSVPSAMNISSSDNSGQSKKSPDRISGDFYIDIVLYCEEKYDDKYYYEKWFDENGLKHEYRLHNQKEKCNDVNCYEFHVRWKHK